MKNLEALYSHIHKFRPGDVLDEKEYEWYVTETNEIIGIPKKEITKRDRQLLNVFLKPYIVNQAVMTKREQEWMQLLYNEDKHVLTEDTLYTAGYRFIFFTLSGKHISQRAFRQAVGNLSDLPLALIWHDKQQGIIIEGTHQKHQPIAFTDTISLLMDDLDLSIKLFVSPFFKDLTRASIYYEAMENCFAQRNTFMQQPVVCFNDIAPLLLVQRVPAEDQKFLTEILLQEALQDRELLDSIKVYLESNLNSTIAAKKLFIHRNSLQYRLEKFMEKTGLDVKQFSQAALVYLALLMEHR